MPHPDAASLTPAEVRQLPDTDERAVLLAALWIDNQAETTLGWDRPAVITQFVHRPDRSTAPAATTIPIGLADPGPMVDKIAGLARKLPVVPLLRDRLVRSDDTYLGVAFITEGWITTKDATTKNPLVANAGRVEARIIYGLHSNGNRFRVERHRNGQPRVTFRDLRIRGNEAGVDEALAQLNDAFNLAYGNPPAKRD